jgi:hypothetical protein
MNGFCGARGAPAGPLGVNVGSVLRRRGCTGGGALQEDCLGSAATAAAAVPLLGARGSGAEGCGAVA